MDSLSVAREEGASFCGTNGESGCDMMNGTRGEEELNIKKEKGKIQIKN